jgi:hypothetical protein
MFTSLGGWVLKAKHKSNQIKTCTNTLHGRGRKLKRKYKQLEKVAT